MGTKKPKKEPKSKKVPPKKKGVREKPSHEMFTMLLNKAPASMFLMQINDTNDFFYVDANYTFFNRTGLTQDNVYGSKLEDHLRKSDTQKIRKIFQSGIKSQSTQQAELFIKLPLGYRWVEMTIEPIIEGGKVVQILGIVTDITTQKNHKKALAQTAARAKAIAEIGNIALLDNTIEMFFSEACQILAETMGIEFIKTMRVSDNFLNLEVIAGHGWEEDIIGQQISVYDGSQSAYSLNSAMPVIVTDAENESRFELSDLQKRHKIKSGMTVAINGVSGPFAVLGVHSNRKNQFTEIDIEFYRTVARHMGSCVKHYQSQLALKRSEQLVSSILKSADIGIYVCDNTGRIIRTNDALCEITGYSHSELNGKEYTLFYPMKSREEKRKNFDSLVSDTDIRIDQEEVFSHKDGRQVDVHLRGTIMRGDWPQENYIFTVTDITQFKKNEKHLNLLQLAATHAKNGIAILNNGSGHAGPEVVYVNKAFEDITKFQAYEVIGQPLSILKGPKTSVTSFKKIQEAFRKNEDLQIDILYQKSNLTDLWTHLSLVPVMGKGGAVDNWLVIIHDITNRKSHESTLMAEKEEAHSNDKAKTNFLAEISHEIRTPLNAIIGFSEIIHKEYFGKINEEKYKGYAEHIYESGEFLLELINGILDLSKVESGENELEETTFKTENLLQDCIKMLRHRAEKGGVNLNIPQTNVYPTILADETKLKQIIINVLTNGIKFTPKDGSIDIKSFINDKDQYTISIKDSGIGIPESEIDTVLSPYKHSNVSTLSKNKGTGLGLPVSKMLASLHGASFDIQSKLGEGTEISITFPVERTISK